MVGESDEELPGGLRRLFPAAYPTDASAEANYVSLVRADLVEHHRNALAVLARDGISHAPHRRRGSRRGSPRSNDLRIVMGASLGVTEEMVEPSPDDPRYAEWLCYDYLTYLESLVVDSLAELLPRTPPTADRRDTRRPLGRPPGWPALGRHSRAAGPVTGTSRAARDGRRAVAGTSAVTPACRSLVISARSIRTEPPSSSGRGHRPFKAETRVRIPLGVLRSPAARYRLGSAGIPARPGTHDRGDPRDERTRTCGAAWSARWPVKPEVAGSNPVRSAEWSLR